MRLALATAVALLFFAEAALADGPKPTAAGTEAGFVRTDKDDAFGYYLPATEIRSGNFVLKTISLGTPDEFAAWEADADPAATYAPFMLSFDDVTSPQAADETGAPYYTRSIRVLPSFYRIGPEQIAFMGSDPAIGHVEFSGRLDRDALKAAADGGMLNSGQKAVLTGDLTIGGKTFKDVAFTWFGGD